MSALAIQADRISKKYSIGRLERYKTLRETISNAFSAPFRGIANTIRGIPNEPDAHREIWALKEVSFEIEHGQAFGIVGRNGAGKSTLLKILSRVTEPTEGQARVFGRVGSLLEVGTGFHPELTGRENIYLNGAILGMRRSEIQRRFDEIVAFAEIDEFLDTPVKRYSSGMYTRLAFAVAAHLDPDILLIDEVLAVGDAAFQKKCLGKMGDVTREGRTVLFVSHNMGAIVQLCPRSILLQSGRVQLMDQSATVVAKYLSDNAAPTGKVRLNPEANPASPAVFTRFWIEDANGSQINVVDVTKAFGLGLRLLVRRQINDVDISIRFRNAFGQALFTSNLSDSTGPATLAPGEHAFLINVPAHFLVPDTYSLIFAIHRPGLQMYDMRDGDFAFQVVESGSNMWQYHGQAYGNILVRFPWRQFADATS